MTSEEISIEIDKIVAKIIELDRPVTEFDIMEMPEFNSLYGALPTPEAKRKPLTVEQASALLNILIKTIMERIERPKPN